MVSGGSFSPDDYRSLGVRLCVFMCTWMFYVDDTYMYQMCFAVFQECEKRLCDGISFFVFVPCVAHKQGSQFIILCSHPPRMAGILEGLANNCL